MSNIKNHQPWTAPGELNEFYVTCGAGLERLLARELVDIGCQRVQLAGSGVRYFGTLVSAYRVCLWSRLANRVLLPIHRGDAATPEELYALAQEIEWSAHLDVDGSLAVDFLTAKSAITHSKFGAQTVKDAVVDQYRAGYGRRPDVDREHPDLRINVYLFRNHARLAIDLSGHSLHRRGYRSSGGPAPLKENLAAAVLVACRWPELAENGGRLFDPMCGSGTLLIEAAMIARNQAPGLHREYQGFIHWKMHDAESWAELQNDARQSVRDSRIMLYGADRSTDAIARCNANLIDAGVADHVRVRQWDVHQGRMPDLPQSVSGLVLSNPPYGLRLNTDEQFFSRLGLSLSRYYPGWHCGLLTPRTVQHRQLNLPLREQLALRNGGLDCCVLYGDIPTSGALRQQTLNTAVDAGSPSTVDEERTGFNIDTVPVLNRIKKNLRVLKSWVKRNRISAYRVYDADLPEFAVAIDLYEGSERHVIVQEYQAPPTVNAAVAQARLSALLAIVPQALDVNADNLHLKVRQKQMGLQQYERRKTDQSIIDHVVENGARLEINFSDYIDVGLFPDHRPVRRFIHEQAEGKRFLNLFCYTGTATLAAITGGARSSVSVDASKRYCEWAQRNMALNGVSGSQHQVIRAEVIDWLKSAVNVSDELFDIIFLDPPTFSNSSTHEQDWNVQRDHVVAINFCMQLLSPRGLLIFSSNFRGFKFDADELLRRIPGIRVEDRTRWSIDRDFQRRQRIHQCWFISR